RKEACAGLSAAGCISVLGWAERPYNPRQKTRKRQCLGSAELNEGAESLKEACAGLSADIKNPADIPAG
ncbi:MAG: hypothetical protein LIO76_04260, partial [Clostridiales bacterium]|nr:hypothetical protein [Clostridiales bacterium]